jgi:GDP-mannose 6-dehydrogenase
LAGTLTTNRLSVADVIDRVVAGEGRTVAILGLSFKVESDDLRESPYVELAETLLGKGYDVRVYDPIVNPSALRGANRQHLESRLPHVRRILRRQAAEALAGADVVIVSFSSPEVAEALVSNRPNRIIDLDGRLGAEVEGLEGYEGVAW